MTEKLFKAGVKVQIGRVLAHTIAQKMTEQGTPSEREVSGDNHQGTPYVFFWADRLGKTLEEAIQNAQSLIDRVATLVGPGEVWVKDQEGPRPAHIELIKACRQIRSLALRLEAEKTVLGIIGDRSDDSPEAALRNPGGP